MIPVWSPHFTEKEKELVAECLETGWISAAGPYVSRFEQDVSRFIGMNGAVAVSSGTAALETALHAMELMPGDEIIMPDFSIISCAVAALRLGLVPVFVDADPQTWNMDMEKVEPAITQNTRAIMPVHIYGRPVDMDRVMKLACLHGLKVIEDCAEALGAEVNGKRVGSFGDCSVFSFFANKTVTTAEGGMVLSNTPETINRARGYRNLYFGQGDDKFVHSDTGFNYRMSNLHAALGVAQMTRVDSIIEKQREIAAFYSSALKDQTKIERPREESGYRNVFWVYGVVLKPEAARTARQLIESMKRRGVECRPFFRGLNSQPALIKTLGPRKKTCPCSDYLGSFGLYLPSGPGLTRKNQQMVIDTLINVLADE